MARMRDLDAQSLVPRVGVAFSRENLPYIDGSGDGVLAEGFITPKKGSSKGSFFKPHDRAADGGGGGRASLKSKPYTISVLVGSRDGIHKWLRASGPGRCALWIEYAASPVGENHKDDRRRMTAAALQLVYRQRDSSVFHVSVLPECAPTLAPAAPMKKAKKKKVALGFGDDDEDFDWTGLRRREMERMSMAVRSDEDGGADSWNRRVAEAPRWSIIMKASAFEQLSEMLAPGGALWEFRRLLAQVIDLPEFLDIDFRDLDLHEWHAHRLYAIFLAGSDTLVVRTMPKGRLMWRILRFCFDDDGGGIMLARGEDLEELESHFGNRSPGTPGIQVGRRAVSNDRKTGGPGERPDPARGGAFEWKILEPPAGSLEAALTSTFDGEEDAVVFKTLRALFFAWREEDGSGPKRLAPPADPGTAFRGSPSACSRLSSKERCALSHLQNGMRAVRLQGLRVLLDLLLDLVRDPGTSSRSHKMGAGWSSVRNNRPAAWSTPGTVRSPHLLQSKPDAARREGHVEETENVSLLSGLMAAMDRQPARGNPAVAATAEKEKRLYVGSQTERALRVAEMNWSRFEELKSARLSASQERSGSFRARFRLRWERVLEWLDHGFLEALLMEGVARRGPEKSDDRGRAPVVVPDVRELADACLQVLGIAPGEGGRRVVGCLATFLHDVAVAVPASRGRGGLDWREKLDEMVCVCRFLALLVSSSVALASGLADADGLALVIDLYAALVKEFPVSLTSVGGGFGDAVIAGALPGGALGNDQRNPVKVLRSLPLGAQRCDDRRATEAKARVPPPTRAASISSRISHALSTIKPVKQDSRVSTVRGDVASCERTSSPKRRARRPHVPRLPLTYLPAVQPLTAHLNPTLEPQTCPDCSNDEARDTRAALPPPPNTIFTMVCEAKLQLLQSLAIMLRSRSVTLGRLQRRLVQKLLVEEAGRKLLTWFLPDLIGCGPSSGLPTYVAGKFKKLIFRVIFLLDKIASQVGTRNLGPRELGSRVQYAEGGPRWSGPGPPGLPAPGTQFSDAMLLELRARMDLVLARLTAATAADPCEALGRGGTSAERHTKAYIAALWADVARLLAVLADCIEYWLERCCRSRDVLRRCGTQVDQTLTHLARLGAAAGWGPAPLFAMQSMLKLLGTCICDAAAATSADRAPPKWRNDAEGSLWAMVVGAPAHWECIQGYARWLALEACQECVGRRLEEFQERLHEPVRSHYRALGVEAGMGGISERGCPVSDHPEAAASPKSAFTFLRLVVALAQRKLDARKASPRDSGSNPLSFLKGIMKPADGLLLTVIKGGPGSLLPRRSEVEASLAGEEDDPMTPRGSDHRWPPMGDPQPDDSRRQEGFGLCGECAKSAAEVSLMSEVALSTEHESLTLLAEIFRLKVPPPERRVAERYGGVEYPNVYVNPFLSNKYLTPFLDTVYSGFMNLYTSAVQSPWPQRVHSAAADTKWACLPCESRAGGCLEAQGAACPSSASEDTISSCFSYARPMLAVAQNLTNDASDVFQRLCVMEFLVDQIALEYEFSQIAGPAPAAQVDGKSVHKEGVTMSGGLRQPCCEELLRGLVGSSSSSSSLGPDSTLRGLALDPRVKSGVPPAGPLGSTKRRFGVVAVPPGHLDRSSSSGCRELMLQWTMNEMAAAGEAPPKPVLPLRERDGNLRSLSERGTESTVTSGRAVAAAWMVRKLYPHDEGDVHLNTFVTKTLYNAGLVTGSLRPGRVTSPPEAENDDDVMGAFLGKRNPRKKKEVVYSGRFFDLNEEVERELEAEGDDDEWTSSCDDRGRGSNPTARELEGRNDNTRNTLRGTGSTGAITQRQPQNFEDSSLSASSSASMSGGNSGRVSARSPGIRPMVPKLNFTKAVQKKGPDTADPSENERLVNVDLGALKGRSDGGEGADAAGGSNSELQGLCLSYEKERWKRRIYHNAGLHVLLLELFISLMLNPEGSLEANYSDRFPMENRKINAPFFLSYHINHASNEYVLPTLAKRLEAAHPSAYRILKLTWRALFDPSLYTNRIRIAQGAFAQVFTATRETEKGSKELVVLKVVDLPRGPHEPCSFFDVYSEVQILERFRGDLRVCQILDYGVDRDTFVLVLKHYKCSLRAWRHRHTTRVHSFGGHGGGQDDFMTAGDNRKMGGPLDHAPFHERLPLYLEVYAAVLQAVKALEVQNVVHYDLKCDNVLLEPLMCTLSDDEFWHPHWPPVDKMCAIPFRVSITDFGQSKASLWEGGECTVRNRGTECVKSPEMLKLLSSTGETDASTSRSLHEEVSSVGKAGDVWGLGCLLYELLTGEYLLYDDDWVRFFMRVTLTTEELIPDEKAAKVDNFAPVMEFLRFVLVRDPHNRPSLDDLMARLGQLQTELKHEAGAQTAAPPAAAAGDIFDELSDDVGEEELPVSQEPAPKVVSAEPVHQAKNKKSRPAPRKRGKTAIPSTGKATFKLCGKARNAKKSLPAKRPPSKFMRLWRRYCACCGRKSDVAS